MKDLHTEILEKIRSYHTYFYTANDSLLVIEESDFYDLATDILKIVKDRENGK